MPFKYQGIIIPQDDFMFVHDYLLDTFHGTDVRVEPMFERGRPHIPLNRRDGADDWIYVTVRSTQHYCDALRKRMRRLARGKPRFKVDDDIVW